MISTITVSYGLTVADHFHNEFIERVFAVATSHKVDCDIKYKKNGISVVIHSFKYECSHKISEKEGAEILKSLVHLFENNFDAHLLICAMESELPF